MGEPSLWSADDQRGRLDELTAGTADPAKDLPLRRDVRLLGILLGRVLVEQVGESLLGVVEELRHIFIQHREQAHPQVLRRISKIPLLDQARKTYRRAHRRGRSSRYQSVRHLFRTHQPCRNQPPQTPTARRQTASRAASAGRLVLRNIPAHARRWDRFPSGA